MWEGYEDNTVQVLEGTVSEIKKGDYDRNAELIVLANEGDERALEALVELNRGLVRSVAIRFRDRGVELDDLFQVGTIGLLKAIKSFDGARGNCFSTYAFPLILGEIRRYIRDEGPIKVSRYYKKISVQLARERNRILTEEGREPKLSELSEAIGVPVEEVAMALEATSPISSFCDNPFGEEEGGTLGDLIADKDSIVEQERFIDNLELSRSMKKMSALWKKIVLLRYFRMKTQQEIADMLGLSQVKVSREEKKIIEFLKSEMSRG